MQKLEAKIIGTGSYLPARVLSNHDLEKLVETSDEWIFTRTGMKERRIAAADEFPSQMGAIAARKALEKAQLPVEQVDLILVATLTPDHLFPSTACLIQRELGAIEAAAMDLQAACTGYLYALNVARAFIESGTYKNILIVATEKLSAIVDYGDRNTCVLFGDGAAAALVSATGKGLRVRDVSLGADGCLAELLIQPAGGSKMPATEETVRQKKHTIQMEGKEVFKHAVRRMEAAASGSLQKVGLREEEIAWFVPHQANIRIIEALAKRFGVPMSQVFLTIHKYGNTSASSVGIALDELLRAGSVQEGDNLLLVAFGSGLTWGASVLTYE